MITIAMVAATLSTAGVTDRYVALPDWMPTDVEARYIPWGLDGSNETRRVSVRTAAVVRGIADGICERLAAPPGWVTNAWEFFDREATDLPDGRLPWPDSMRVVPWGAYTNAVSRLADCLEDRAGAGMTPLAAFCDTRACVSNQTDYWSAEWTAAADPPRFPLDAPGLAGEIVSCWPAFGREGSVRYADLPQGVYFVRRFDFLGVRWTDAASAASGTSWHSGRSWYDAMRDDGLPFALYPPVEYEPGVRWLLVPQSRRLDWARLGGAAALLAVLNAVHAEGDDSAVCSNVVERIKRTRRYVMEGVEIDYVPGRTVTAGALWSDDGTETADSVRESDYRMPVCRIERGSTMIEVSVGGPLSASGPVGLETMERWLSTRQMQDLLVESLGLFSGDNIVVQFVSGGREIVFRFLDWAGRVQELSYDYSEGVPRPEAQKVRLAGRARVEAECEGEHLAAVDLRGASAALWPAEEGWGALEAMDIEAMETMAAKTNLVGGVSEPIESADGIYSPEFAGAWLRAAEAFTVRGASAARRRRETAARSLAAVWDVKVVERAE